MDKNNQKDLEIKLINLYPYIPVDCHKLVIKKFPIEGTEVSVLEAYESLLIAKEIKSLQTYFKNPEEFYKLIDEERRTIEFNNDMCWLGSV